MIIPNALKQMTIKRFTNLLDGKTLPDVSVQQILVFLESDGKSKPVVIDHFMENFRNDAMIQDEYDDEHF